MNRSANTSSCIPTALNKSSEKLGSQSTAHQLPRISLDFSSQEKLSEEFQPLGLTTFLLWTLLLLC